MLASNFSILQVPVSLKPRGALLTAHSGKEEVRLLGGGSGVSSFPRTLPPGVARLFLGSTSMLNTPNQRLQALRSLILVLSGFL